MSQFLKKNKKFFIVGAVLLVIGAIVLSRFSGSSGQPKSDIFEVKALPLQQSIDATGSLKPTSSLDLSFKKTAQVKSIQVEVGARVHKGDLLAELQNNKEKALLDQNKGLLNEASANLKLKLSSATKEDIDMVRSDLSQALANQEKSKVNLSNAQLDFDNTQKTTAQDIETAQLDFQNAQLNLEKVKVTTNNSTLQSTTNIGTSTTSYLASIGDLLVTSKSTLQTIDKMYGIQTTEWFFKNKANLFIIAQTDYQKAQGFLIKAFADYQSLNTLYSQLSKTSPPASLQAADTLVQSLINNVDQLILTSSSTLDKITTDIDFNIDDILKLKAEVTTAGKAFDTSAGLYNTANKNFSDAFTNNQSVSGTVPVDLKSAQITVDQKQQNLNKVKINSEVQISNKKAALDSAKAELKVQQSLVDKAQAGLGKILAPPRGVDIAPYQARVEQAQALVLSSQSDFDDTQLKAPFDGIISARNIEIGENSSVGTGGTGTKAAFSMIDDSKFHIDVNIPETQVNRINDQSKVTVTFDAVQNAEFEGKILLVEPAANDVQGTIYYKAKIALVKNDPRLRSDMTANVSIHSEQPQSSLLIPERAITIGPDGKKMVQIAPASNQVLIQTVQVVTGLRGQDGMIEIVSGLKEGQKILVPSSVLAS